MLSLCYSWVDDLLVYGETDSACSLDLLAIIVESPGDDRLGAVFVRGCAWGREFIGGGIIEILIVSPVGAAVKMDISKELVESRWRKGK